MVEEASGKIEVAEMTVTLTDEYGGMRIGVVAKSKVFELANLFLSRK